jgi:hypothetical protein
MAKVIKLKSEAGKLVIRVPQTDRVVNFPEGCTISEWGKGNDRPMVIVHNATDTKVDKRGTYQGARFVKTNPQYVINNTVPEALALKALAMLTDGFTIEDLDKVIEFLVKSDMTDMYTTDLEFLSGNCTPAGLCLELETKEDGKVAKLAAGQVKRDGRDLIDSYLGDDGYVYVKLSDGDRRVEDHILVETYRNADGSKIDIEKLKKQFAS